MIEHKSDLVVCIIKLILLFLIIRIFCGWILMFVAVGGTAIYFIRFFRNRPVESKSNKTPTENYNDSLHCNAPDTDDEYMGFSKWNN